MDNPKCRWCGKPLRKYTYAVSVPTNTPPKEYKGRPVLQVTRTYKFLSGDTYLFNLWLGDWGGYGDSCFCGLRCGYQWSVSKLVK
jgi:hypothetical protein